MDNKIEKWQETEFEWGSIFRLAPQFKNSENSLEYLDNDYWFMGSWDERGPDPKQADLDAHRGFYIKYWEFKKHDTTKEHTPKMQKKSTEYNFILKGKIKGKVHQTKDIILESGDFVKIHKGFCVNLQEQIIEDTRGITIKFPGFKNDEDKEICK